MRNTFFLSLTLVHAILLGKVYDCFPFFNELDLLEIRINELQDVVDYFVLVESVETQRGVPKPLYFAENKQRFAPYAHKIIHVCLSERHPEFSLWERENYQRNSIVNGLTHCKNKDIIFISDLDEIPRKEFVLEAKRKLKQKEAKALSFQMDMYRFHLNRPDAIDYWIGTVATTYQNLMARSPQYFRDKSTKFPTFQHAGWHFSWMGGKKAVRMKMQSVVEGKDNVDEMTDEYIDTWFSSAPVSPLDDSFPRYVLEHKEELLDKDLLAPYADFK